MTAPAINFHLCAEGWRLYDLFVNGGIIWRVYLRHRLGCGECTKPLPH